MENSLTPLKLYVSTLEHLYELNLTDSMLNEMSWSKLSKINNDLYSARQKIKQIVNTSNDDDINFSQEHIKKLRDIEMKIHPICYKKSGYTCYKDEDLKRVLGRTEDECAKIGYKKLSGEAEDAVIAYNKIHEEYLSIEKDIDIARIYCNPEEFEELNYKGKNARKLLEEAEEKYKLLNRVTEVIQVDAMLYPFR